MMVMIKLGDFLVHNACHDSNLFTLFRSLIIRLRAVHRFLKSTLFSSGWLKKERQRERNNTEKGKTCEKSTNHINFWVVYLASQFQRSSAQFPNICLYAISSGFVSGIKTQKNKCVKEKWCKCFSFAIFPFSCSYIISC